MELLPARQAQLGDDEDIESRLEAQSDDVSARLASLGADGIQKPKDLLLLVLDNIKHKSVGGSVASS